MLLSGCIFTDNQKLASKAALAKTNPPPMISASDALVANSRHKILIGIIDSGVDYNHPDLIQNIHYAFNPDGSVRGAGWDFLTNDPLPAPYVARTMDIDPNAPIRLRESSAVYRKFFSTVILSQPLLEKYFDADRATETEIEQMGHGTHVSGLASRGMPEIGIIPYRALPTNVLKSQAAIYQNAFRQLLAATSHAIESGARIINLSLGGAVPSKKDRMAKIYTEARERFDQLVKQNPNVIFVAASGNTEGEFVDLKSGHFPCGLNRPNVLCVTGSRRSGNGFVRASFSTEVDSSLRQIRAIGAGMSAVPTLNCASEYGLPDSEAVEAILSSKEEIEEYARQLMAGCSEPPLRKVMVGTSMAAPRAARELAIVWMENPQLTSVQAIDALISKHPNGIEVLLDQAQ